MPCSYLNLNTAEALVKSNEVFEMIENNDIRGVENAVSDGFEINRRYEDYDGGTPLWAAIRHNNPEMAELLLKMGANPNLKDSYDSTPLMTAILWANIRYLPENFSERGREHAIEIFNILLKYNADVNYNGTYGGSSGITALGASVNVADYELSLILTKTLLDAGAEVNPKREPGEMTPLFWALTNVFTRWEESGHDNRAELIKMLLDAGADPNAVYESLTPLHWTAAKDFDLTKILLDAGADKTAKDSRGRTPYVIAMQNLNFRIMKLFAKY
jgi:ankyrin repeat protein